MLAVLASMFGLLIRLPLAVWPSGVAGDGNGVLSKIYGLSKKNWISYDIHDAANSGGYFPRPALFHYFVSRSPQKYWRLFSVILNIGFDIFCGWIAAYVIFKVLDGTSSPSQAILYSLLGMLIFYTAPILMPVTARLKSTNNRSMGLFLCTCFFVCFFYTQDDSIWGFIGLFIFIYLIIIGSTFATQVAFLYTPILAILTGNYNALLVVFGSVLLLWLIKATHVKEILTFKWHHIKFYNENLKTSFSTQGRRFLLNSLSFIFTKKGFAERLRLLLHDAPLLIVLYSIPFLLVFVFWVIKEPSQTVNYLQNLGEKDIHSFCIAMGVTTTIVFVITSIGKGKILGESERYFQYALPFLVPLFIAHLNIDEPIHLVLLCFLVFIQLGITIFIHFLSLKNSFPSLLFFKHSKEVEKILQWFSSNEPNAVVATIPIRFGRALSSQQLNTKTVRCKFYYQMIIPREKLNEGLITYISEMHNKNTFKITPKELNERYGVNVMIVDHNVLEKRNPDYAKVLDQYEKVEINERLFIYRIRS